ncbi:metallophosphoesterase [Tissierella creatinini]|nr:metallophosphoesterase [Tissierella creatinini]TJX61847.1 metallophosphoesterase [Soehngenia saccharolytica]
MSLRKILLTLVLLAVVFSIYNYKQISKYYINKINLKSNKIVEPIRITQITDFHSNQNINLDDLFEDIKDFNPHMILLTGDIIDYKTSDFSLAAKVLEQSKSITSRVFFINGNHEIRNKYYNEFQLLVEKNGITILDDSWQVLEIGNNKIKLFGSSFYADKNDYGKLFKDISPQEYNILLSHSPNRPINYLYEDTDLILSGHTHGGQVRLPLIGGIIAPGQGAFPKYDKGIFQVGNTVLYIDSGLGNSVYPIRAFNRVQITNITIE